MSEFHHYKLPHFAMSLWVFVLGLSNVFPIAGPLYVQPAKMKILSMLSIMPTIVCLMAKIHAKERGSTTVGPVKLVLEIGSQTDYRCRFICVVRAMS